MEYLQGRTPEQLLWSYQFVFPLPTSPGPVHAKACKNFASWVLGLRPEGILEKHLQLGKQSYDKLRTVQTAKDYPGLRFKDIKETIEFPQKKDDMYIQTALKTKQQQQQIGVLPSRARCFTCGRFGHYSNTCRVFKHKPDTRPKKKRPTPEVMTSVAFNISTPASTQGKKPTQRRKLHWRTVTTTTTPTLCPPMSYPTRTGIV
uniref:Uncharacterized protein H25N7.07 n=1 Tax=Trypanosoma brucei TaxID=5691 RepID=Q8WPT0_9TRYP|nr:hypothetical protein [Trypanosoma brucei]